MRNLAFRLTDLSVCVCALCDPMDCSPPGSSDHGILQARSLEWVAIFFFRGSFSSRDQTCVSCITCFASGSFTAEPRGSSAQT